MTYYSSVRLLEALNVAATTYMQTKDGTAGDFDNGMLNGLADYTISAYSLDANTRGIVLATIQGKVAAVKAVKALKAIAAMYEEEA